MIRYARTPDTIAARRLYQTARWKAIRASVLSDSPLCVYCQELGRITPATEVDHVIPHKGDASVFFDGPFQGLCRTCHNSTKDKEERRSYRIGHDASGKPLDPKHHWNR